MPNDNMSPVSRGLVAKLETGKAGWSKQPCWSNPFASIAALFIGRPAQAGSKVGVGQAPLGIGSK